MLGAVVRVRAGVMARARKAAMSLSSTIARNTASSINSILETSCDVRKPSKKCTKGRLDRHDAICEMSAQSIVSCTELAQSMAQPVERQAITSL